MPKISIIVPVYNVENYLRQCLDSLLCQTFTDFELICINDGSTDSSLDILREYAAGDERIRLISKENEGYGKTMNRGLNEARAPYIGIVESDDFVKPEMFQKLYETIEEHSVDLVKCNFYKYTVEEGEDIEYSCEYPESIYGQVLEPIDHPEVYFANSSIWAALYNKQFLDKNKIRFNETPGASFQDISFQFKILSSAKKMMVIEEALLYYRTDNLMSSVHSPSKIYCICDEIHVIEAYINEQTQDRQKKLWTYLTKRKYYDYRWNYFRLSSVFQYAFFEKMIAEFKEDYAAGKFERMDWLSPFDKIEFENIMADPYKFFMSTVKQYRDSRIYMSHTLNEQLGKIGFFSKVQEENTIVIYGAGKIGEYVAQRLIASGIGKQNLIFAVTDIQAAEKEIDGILIKQIDEVAGGHYKDRLILIAVKGEKQIMMLNHLIYLGCKNVIVIDEEVLSFLY